MAARQSFRPKAGKQIGDWKLVDKLGEGGNANVWKAVKDDGSTAAIKILKPSGATRYKRFRAEVELLLTLGPHPGVLPLLDSYLPDSANDATPAWLAMPVATGIVEALGANPALELVVESVASMAEILAALSVNGICHRDIKPGNLYQHDGAWKIGDFGLADYPSKEALTVPGNKLGPMHFMADEMIANADTADGEAADVFSLSKTLWVLAAGQNYPPQGQLRFDIPQLRLSSYVAHPRSQILDLVIERATHPDPKQRPRMSQVAEELSAWLRPATPADLSSTDISDLGPHIQAAVAPLQRANARKGQAMKLVRQIPETLKSHLRPLREEVAKYYSQTPITRDPGILQVAPANRNIGSPQVWWEETFAVKIISDPMRLSSGFGVRLTDDENLEIIAAHVLYYAPPDRGSVLSVPQNRGSVWHDTRVAPIGSALQERAIAELARRLSETLRVALKSFLDQSGVSAN